MNAATSQKSNFITYRFNCFIKYLISEMVFEVILLKFNCSLGHGLEYHTETIQMFQEENDGITSSSKNEPMNKRSSN